MQTSYPSMHLANWQPGKPDMLSQHAGSQSKARKARHAIHACSGSQSQHGKARPMTPAYTAQMLSQHTLSKLTCIKEAAKAQNSGQADTTICCTSRRTRVRGAAKQAATTPWETRQEVWGKGLHQLSWKLEDQKMEYKLGSWLCCFSTTEGEPELYPRH